MKANTFFYIVYIIMAIVFALILYGIIMDKRLHQKYYAKKKLEMDKQIAKHYDPAWDNDFSSSDAEI